MAMPDFEEYWHWCLAQYAQPGLQDMLLSLQDEYGQVVMEVLLALWLLEQGRLPGPLEAAEAEWLAGSYVAPLRELRRSGKPAVAAGLLSEATYQQLLQLEVDAEQLLARSLYSAGLTAPEQPPGAPPDQLLAAALPGVPAPRLRALLQALEPSRQS